MYCTISLFIEQAIAIAIAIDSTSTPYATGLAFLANDHNPNTMRMATNLKARSSDHRSISYLPEMIR